TMFSGGGITFKSVVHGVPNLTCIVSRKSRDVIYPRVTLGKKARAVLQVVSGATSCQVESGQYQAGKQNAVFIVNNTRLTVAAIQDPVFGIKAVGKRSLIQVKKGAVRVGSKKIGRNQQLVVAGTRSSVSPLKLDPVLRPG